MPPMPPPGSLCDFWFSAAQLADICARHELALPHTVSGWWKKLADVRPRKTLKTPGRDALVWHASALPLEVQTAIGSRCPVAPARPSAADPQAEPR
jgi:hypothetical protein